MSIDGFKSAVIDAGIMDAHQLSRADLDEIFNLISGTGALNYAEYMVELDRRTRQYFPKEVLQQIEESVRLGESSRTLEQSASWLGAPSDASVRGKPQGAGGAQGAH